MAGITPPSALLAVYGLDSDAVITALTGGLINQTYRVESGARRFTLQRVNPIFQPQLHLDIESITAHLVACRLPTPTLVRTTAGQLWTHDAEGRVWRLMTHLPGR